MSRRSHQRRAPGAGRATLLAVCSATLAVSAHTLADGRLPQVSVTLTLTLLIGWLSVAVAEHTRGVLGTLLVLGGAQAAMHWLFAGLAPHEGGGGHGITMPVAHAVATLLTALALTHAETMLAVAVASLRMLLPVAWTSAPVPAPKPRHAVVRASIGTLVVEVMLHRVCRRRGPPLPS
ncbi:hypothetical protein [Qaidamihabitans albus]|uniref:hypothetical protein n=1 Tax=Qaidamihabitans albus TaxID=2795733 RepID=UPI0027DBFD36|nr:hypothetical protein [Qaidamihabitans albus]